MAFGWSLLGSETVILSQEVSLITCEFNRIWRVKNNFWNGSLLLFLMLVVIYYHYFMYIFFSYWDFNSLQYTESTNGKEGSAIRLLKFRKWALQFHRARDRVTEISGLFYIIYVEFHVVIILWLFCFYLRHRGSLMWPRKVWELLEETTILQCRHFIALFTAIFYYCYYFSIIAIILMLFYNYCYDFIVIVYFYLVFQYLIF